MTKASVKLGGVALAGNSGIQWQFVSGVAPYRTVVQCHKSDWGTLRGRMGSALTLDITDSRGKTTRVKEVYILHEVPSDSAARKSFVIADRRWKWTYKLVVRDYNITRKTGNRTAFGNVPIELDQVVDVYDYLNYSLQQDGKRWTAKLLLEDVLNVIEEGSYNIESLPVKEGGDEGELPIQNVSLRDSGDVAVARALSYIPGADIYVNAEGRVIVYDGTDIQAAGQYLENLPDWTRAGDYPVEVDRKKIRPSKVVVHYQREVEVLFEFKDDYNTTAPPNPDLPYLENVVPCVDRQTTVTEFDPFLRRDIEKKNLPPGTYVNMQSWLAAMDKDRPTNTPWTFDTIRVLWTVGDLEGALGAGGKDLDEDVDISARVSALRQHFRQTFRINPVYMQRIRSLRAVRVALYDPVSGARAPASVWGQTCIIPNAKGKRMSKRGDVPPEESTVFRNVDYLAPDAADPEINIVATTPAPARVTIIDEELGIFRVEWIAPPAGTVESFTPGMLVSTSNQPQAATRDMSQQDDKPIGLSVRVESGATGLALDATTQMKVLMTVVPSSPNNEKQFQRREVEPSAVKSRYRGEYGIDGGDGPDLEVFVPPGEMTARFAWLEDDVALTTTQQLFGIGANAAGIEGPDLPGYIFTNDGEGTQAGAGRHIYAHSLAMAAESLAAYADSWQGSVASPLPGQNLKLVGNMSNAGIRIGQAPSAKVDAVVNFPGQQRPISRFSLLPDSTRSQVLGTLPFRS